MPTKAILLALLLTALEISPAAAQGSRIELHPIHTLTPTDQQFLTGARDAPAALIAGELRIPRSTVPRLPVVVLLHGSGGVGNNVATWAQELNALGIAVFIVDAFTGRGLVSTNADQDQLSRLAHVVDAYRSLAILTRHPRIDPARIFLMGFSRGGGAAHWAAIQRFRDLHGPEGDAQFAGFIPVYGTCNRRFVDELRVAARPIRYLHGLADDYVPAAECEALARRLRAAGADAAFTGYAGAHHVFDDPASIAAVRQPRVHVSIGCDIAEGPDGRLMDRATGQPFTYATAPCVTRGATTGGNEEARRAALQAVRELVLGAAR